MSMQLIQVTGLRHLDTSLLERLLENAGLTQFELSDVEGMWNEWYRKFSRPWRKQFLSDTLPLCPGLGSVLS